MAFTKVDKTVEELNVHTSLSRTPNASDNLDYKELQSKWDSTGQYIADKINSLIDELEGVNAAPSIGIFPDERFIESGTPLTTIQQALGFLYEQIRNAAIGGLVENSIGYQYLRKAAGEEAITTETIRNLAVTTAKIANAAITATKIAMNAITSEKIADGAVTTGKLPNGAVTTDKLTNGSVTTEKLSNSSVTNEKIKNGTIDLATKTTGKLSLQNGGTGADNAADARTNLDAQQTHKTATVTIATTNWNSSNECTKTVTGVTASNLVIAQANDATIEEASRCIVRMKKQAANSLTFHAKVKPTTSLTFNIAIFD